MAEAYTVQTVMKTGNGSPQFGNEYFVKFNESEGTFKLWFKSDPTEGQVINGTIDGSKFTKEKKEWSGATSGQSSTASSPSSAGTPSGAGSGVRSFKDNSDGMRQGMCINNAANYVNTVATESVDAKTWAKTVHSYATELYKLGDLNAN